MHRRRFGTVRRAPTPGALSAIGASALALAVFTTACSGPSSGRPAAAAGSARAAGSAAGAGSSPSPSALTGSPIGVLDTDPADPPTLNPSLQAGKPLPSGFRGEPTALRPPASWNPGPWLSQVHSAAGSKAAPSNSSDPQYVTTAWRWSAPGISTLTVGVNSDGQNRALKIDCAAEGFDAADGSVAAEISGTLELCARTGLSGTAAQTAGTWIGKQVGPILADIRTGFRGRAAVSASPSFGDATYQVIATYQFQYGYLIQVVVW